MVPVTHYSGGVAVRADKYQPPKSVNPCNDFSVALLVAIVALAVVCARRRGHKPE
jgi:hypothetical protein